MSASVAENLSQVRERIRVAAERTQGNPADVTIVAVSKTVAVPRIREALAAGLRILGENRVQESIPKIDEIGTTDARWHLIGHLQSNKVRFIEGRFSMVQSIDSIKIAEAIGGRVHRELDVLIEVNVGQEPRKTGVLQADVAAIAASIERLPNLRLRGLMTVAPMAPDPEEVRPIFRKLRTIRDETSEWLGRPLPVLSMGMSDDYPIAVEEGATMLRLGRALFGPR